MRTAFEYQVLTLTPGWVGVDPAQLERELNALGAVGWELVAISETPGTQRKLVAVLKRPRE